MHVGLGGPRRPAHTELAPKHPGILPEHVHLHIPIPDFIKKSQWQLSKAVSLRFLGTPEGSSNDGSIPYSQRVVSCISLGSFIIFHVRRVPICYTPEASEGSVDKNM